MYATSTAISHHPPPSTPAKMSVLYHHSITLPFLPTPALKPQLPTLIFSIPPFLKKRHPTISPIYLSSSKYSYSYSDSSEPSKPNPSFSPQDDNDDEEPDRKPKTVTDEWGEKGEAEPEPPTKFSGPDPPGEEADDEWGGVGVKDDRYGNGSPGVEVDGESQKLRDLKRALVDTVYGTDFGFRASSELRAEAIELIAQLEAANPNPAPTESPELLDGNWVLLFTAFSELLPLLATGSLPLVKVEKISQSVNSSSLTIDNSTTISGPVASLSFSASAAFEVRSPSRIQVQFKEGTLNPPEIKSSIDLPEDVDIFGQKINLSPVQQSLNPLQNAVAGIGRAISGQPPLKIPIPGERAKSWLLITYLDKDLRISRGDGGLFVLAKEGSTLLDQ
ncbi:plastoglobulin-1, chloroplastic [Coffea eugenioides]|uniref:Plastoglobulin-1, chloroplastic-like n=1 Tax=Coffea arabica TaxID=13443 RepID=A0A6P6TU86_COFAR|nr:plastoglobulin-1, chloroplastic-like [Coffea arabica]XP_027085552.1 plastoglobulin-1, chloroplastic [Coffea arabica]XP_027183468.1 plastoglobulin-1, chloroplastic [Coffea eugenioides]